MEQPMVSVNFATQVWNSMLPKKSQLTPKLVFELYKEIPMAGSTELERVYLFAKKIEEYLNNDAI